jgi:hypothetical protein
MSFFVGFSFTAEALRRGLDPERILDDIAVTGANKIMFIARDPWGCEFRPDKSCYDFTRFAPEPSADAAPGDDPLGRVCEAAASRGIGVYAHNLAYECATLGYWPATKDSRDMSARILRNFSVAAQIDIFGRKSFRVCTNHPDYRQFYFSLIEDQLRHYPIEGIKWNLERNGPLSSVLVGNYAADFRYRKPLAPVCFCPHCLEEARRRGINTDRAKQGWMELLQFSERSWRAARVSGDPFAGDGPVLGGMTETATPPDGYFITFLRIIMRYPEILMWNQMWYDSLLEFTAQAYGLVKLVGPERKFGIHVWHHRAFSIFERAMYDYSEMRRYADWIKPKMDHTCAGFRFNQDSRRYIQALFPDRNRERAYQAWCTMLGWEEELPLDDLPAGGMSLAYLRRDTASAVAAVAGEIPIYPGIGIDMPSPTRAYTEDSIAEALRTVYEAGAQGVLLTRNYLEMNKAHMAAAGRAIAEIRAEVDRRATTMPS